MKVSVSEYLEDGGLYAEYIIEKEGSNLMEFNQYFLYGEKPVRFYFENEVDGEGSYIPKGGRLEIGIVPEPEMEYKDEYVIQARNVESNGLWFRYTGFDNRGEAQKFFDSIVTKDSDYNWRLIRQVSEITVL